MKKFIFGFVTALGLVATHKATKSAKKSFVGYIDYARLHPEDQEAELFLDSVEQFQKAWTIIKEDHAHPFVSQVKIILLVGREFLRRSPSVVSAYGKALLEAIRDERLASGTKIDGKST